MIKITFLLNFDWMHSLSDFLVNSAAILTTLMSVLGKSQFPFMNPNANVPGACGAENFYREKYNLWHIGQNDRSAYLYNLTGTEKLQFETANFNSTGGTVQFLSVYILNIIN